MSRTDKIIKKIKIMLFGVSCPYRACAFCKEPGKNAILKNWKKLTQMAIVIISWMRLNKELCKQCMRGK